LDQNPHRNIIKIIDSFNESIENEHSLTIITTLVIDPLSKNIHQTIDDVKESVINLNSISKFNFLKSYF